MVMATVLPNEFDKTILDTLEHCIIKMSEKLKKIFDPDKPESQSLFRVFCSAINTRSRIVHKIVKSIDKAKIEVQIMEKAKTLVNDQLSRLENTPAGTANACSIPQKTKKGGGTSFWRNRKLA